MVQPEPSAAAPQAPPRWRRWLLAAIVVTAVVGGAAALTASAWLPAETPAGFPKRFAVVAEGELYRSGQPTARELETVLRVHGIKAVISLCKDSPAENPDVAAEIECLRANKVEFRQLPTDTPPSPEQVRAFLAAIGDPALPGPLLIHCEAGRTRTGAMVAIWRMRHQGWSNEKALTEARDRGLKDPETITVVRDFKP